MKKRQTEKVAQQVWPSPPQPPFRTDGRRGSQGVIAPPRKVTVTLEVTVTSGARGPSRAAPASRKSTSTTRRAHDDTMTSQYTTNGEEDDDDSEGDDEEMSKVEL